MHLERDGFLVSDDPARLDFDVVQRLMESSYWASERPRDVTETSAKHSVCFGLYAPDGTQVGFMRVVTDYLTFAWLCDVIIDERHRGSGLGRWMLQAVLEQSELRDVRRWMLATRDAHAFYRDYGFVPVTKPEMWMERVRR
jgi:GNAT superfamily N-acetyltransferase